MAAGRLENSIWGNGDGRFIYPPEAAADANPANPVLDGPVDSIRWEMLRDGIEDYEYFVILSVSLTKNGKVTAEQARRIHHAARSARSRHNRFDTFHKRPETP